MSCSAQTPGQIGLVGRIATGHQPAELTNSGFTVYSLTSEAEGRTAAQDETLIAIGRHKSDGSVVSVASLGATSGLASVAPVLSQSSDPTLRSCFYKLNDSSGALPYLHAGQNALVKRGYVTEGHLSDASTSYMISDNPLDSTEILLTMIVPGAKVTLPSTSNGPSVLGLRSFVVRLARDRMTVIAAGYGSWYLD
jgi:hypothetical protein